MSYLNEFSKDLDLRTDDEYVKKLSQINFRLARAERERSQIAWNCECLYYLDYLGMDIKGIIDIQEDRLQKKYDEIAEINECMQNVINGDNR